MYILQYHEVYIFCVNKVPVYCIFILDRYLCSNIWQCICEQTKKPGQRGEKMKKFAASSYQLCDFLYFYLLLFVVSFFYMWRYFHILSYTSSFLVLFIGENHVILSNQVMWKTKASLKPFSI